jgi:hypothetical protein
MIDLSTVATIDDVPPPAPLDDSTYDLREAIAPGLVRGLAPEHLQRMHFRRGWGLGLASRVGDWRHLLHLGGAS